MGLLCLPSWQPPLLPLQLMLMPSSLVPDMLASLDTPVLLELATPDLLEDTLVLLELATPVLLEEMLEKLLLLMLPELLLPQLPPTLLPLLCLMLLPPLSPTLPPLWPQSTTPSTSPLSLSTRSVSMSSLPQLSDRSESTFTTRSSASPRSMLTPRPPTPSAITSSTTLPKLVPSLPLLLLPLPSQLPLPPPPSSPSKSEHKIVFILARSKQNFRVCKPSWVSIALFICSLLKSSL